MADMYYAEKQLVKTLPKLAEKAKNSELSMAFKDHLEETRNHVARLEQAMEMLNMPVKGEKCPAMDGIIKEGSEIMDDFSDDPALDAGLVAAGQKAEHYEIATYGYLCEWASVLGFDKVRALLHQNLEEEKAANDKLTRLAKNHVNEEGLMAEAPRG